MPELSRFYGIIVRMFVEPLGKHNEPHFHAYYQEHSAVVTIAPVFYNNRFTSTQTAATC